MSVEGLEQFSKNQLIEELINRQTFVGIVIFHREDVKSGRLGPGEIVMTKSPPLARENVEQLLQLGQSLVGGMFGEGAARVPDGPAEMFPLHADRPPLRIEQGGAIRVGSSRINLDLVVEQYENGMTPEDMVRAYDTLVLADVYATIAFYLRHQDEVWAYLKRREVEAAALKEKIESDRARVSREDLLARRTAGEQEHASAGQ